MTRTRFMSMLSSDTLMLMAWGCWLTLRVLGESTLPLASVSTLARVVQLLSLVAAMVHGALAPVEHTPRAEGLWLGAIALLCVSGYVSNNYVLAQAAMLVYGSRGMKKAALYRESLLIVVVLCVSIVILSQLGAIEDVVVVTRADRVRHCLGFPWPSRLPNFLFTIIMLLVLIRGRYLHASTRAVLFILVLLLYNITKSRGPFLASSALIVCSVLITHRVHDPISAPLRIPLMGVFPFCALLTIVPSLVYDHSVPWMSHLNWLSSNRLIYSHNAIVANGVTLFGSPLFDDASMSNHLAGYLDAAYLRALCSLGLVAFVLLMTVLVMMTKSAVDNNDRPMLACLVVCALHSCLEGNLLWMQYTPLLFAASDSIDECLGVSIPTSSSRKDAVALFAVCTPFQLFSALCVRLNDQLCDRTMSCDLLVSPNFPHADEYARQLNCSGLFDNVILFSSYEGTYFPQVKDFFDYLFHGHRRRQAFNEHWPLPGRRYTQVYCADPNTVIDVRLFQCKEGADVILFDEGAGSYNGSMTSTFAVDNAAVNIGLLGFGFRQRIKFAIKDLASILDVRNRYQFVPAMITLFNTGGSVRRYYRDVPLRSNALPDLNLITEACPLLGSGDTGFYRDAGIVFFASWDDALPVAQQLDLAHRLSEETGRAVVFRPHPRSVVHGFEANDVIIDDEGALWELLYLSGIVSKRAILVGFASTAQIMPKVLCDDEPPLILLPLLLSDSVPYKQRLVRAAEQFQELYVNKACVQIPRTASELHDVVKALEHATPEKMA